MLAENCIQAFLTSYNRIHACTDDDDDDAETIRRESQLTLDILLSGGRQLPESSLLHQVRTESCMMILALCANTKYACTVGPSMQPAVVPAACHQVSNALSAHVAHADSSLALPANCCCSPLRARGQPRRPGASHRISDLVIVFFLFFFFCFGCCFGVSSNLMLVTPIRSLLWLCQPPDTLRRSLPCRLMRALKFLSTYSATPLNQWLFRVVLQRASHEIDPFQQLVS